MSLVIKEITSGASYYSQTTAVGNLERVQKTFVLSCGSGDDYRLNAEERKMVAAHDPKEGTLNLPSGPLRRRKSVTT